MGVIAERFARTAQGQMFKGDVRWKNDCPVRALKALADLPLDDAVRGMEAVGWRPGTGSMLTPFVSALAEHGALSMVPKNETRGKTAAQFAARTPKGRYAVIVRDHVMALIDGELRNMEGYGDDQVLVALHFRPRS
jgi:hypothetical protein